MRSHLLFLLPIVACGPKKVATVAPPRGWHAEEGWAGACWYPPDFEKLDATARRVQRQETLEAMKAQWLGERTDGVSMESNLVDDVDMTLLGSPDDIEAVSQRNLAFCQEFMSGGGDTGAWQAWLTALPAQLTEGECVQPFDYQLIQYLDIGGGWQENIHFCQGDRVIVQATRNDKYRIVEKGPWINAEGDTSLPATDASLPCNIEGCYHGQLVGRFVTEAGVTTVFPIGAELHWEAPEHGYFSFTINDNSYFDNVWRKDGVVIDHTAVTFTPAE